jgi:hypothetical protein
MEMSSSALSDYSAKEFRRFNDNYISPPNVGGGANGGTNGGN